MLLNMFSAFIFKYEDDKRSFPKCNLVDHHGENPILLQRSVPMNHHWQLSVMMNHHHHRLSVVIM